MSPVTEDIITTDDIKNMVESSIPESSVEVRDIYGTSDHFEIVVRSGLFTGKSRIEQHKMVQAALGESLTTTIHAVEIKTLTPES